MPPAALTGPSATTVRFAVCLAHCAAALLLASASPSLAAAQTNRAGTILGRVVDANGAAIPGTTVAVVPQVGTARLSPDAWAASGRATQADDAGAFRLSALPPGSYQLRAQRIGFQATVITEIALRAQQTVEIRVTLRRAVTELAPMVVAAPAVTIRREDTELGSVLRADAIARLPVGLDTRAIVAFTPGARAETVWGGASAQANSYQLDGLATNHPGIGGQLLQPNVSWVDALEVRGLGANAELGNFQGGVINVVTRSGSNERHARVRANVETHRLNDSNVGVAEAVPELAGRQELEAEASGAMVRDRLFYYGSGQLVRRDLRVLDQIVDPSRYAAGQDERDELKLFGKLTWQATGRDLVNLTALHGAAHGEHSGRTGFETLDATRRLDAPASHVALAWQRRGERRALEVKLSAARTDEHLAPYEGAGVPGLSTFRSVDDQRYQNAPFEERRRAHSVSGSVVWQGDFTTGGIGHTIKAGGEHSSGTWTDRRTRTGGLTWRPATSSRGSSNPFVADAPASWFVNGTVPFATGGEMDLDATVWNSALFLQDQITLTPRLSVSPGLRYGRWVGRLRADDGGAHFTAATHQAIEPRLGFIADLTSAGDFVAKAHWGRYHQSMFAQIFDRADGSAVFSNERLWYYRGASFDDPRRTLTPSEIDALVGAGQAQLVQEQRLNETGPVEGYRQPYVDQLVLGLEKTFGAQWKAEARYVHRRNGRMVALRDRNLATNHTAFQDVLVLDRFGAPVRDANGAELRLPTLHVRNDAILEFLRRKAAGDFEFESIPGFTVADTARLAWDPDYALTTVPEARRRFEQVQLALTRGSPRWTATASVVLTRLEGNLGTVTGYTDERGRGAGPYVHPNESLNYDGPLEDASELEGKLLATGQLPWGLRGGLFYTFRSGDRATPTLTLSGSLYDYVPAGAVRLQPLITLPLVGQQIYVEQRGLYRLPNRSLLDVHLERPFAVGGAEVVLAMDVFNVLGESAVTRINTRLGADGDPQSTSAFGAARAREAPRTLRVGTTVSF